MAEDEHEDHRTDDSFSVADEEVNFQEEDGFIAASNSTNPAMNLDNNRTINAEEEFVGGTEEAGTFLDQNTSGAPLATVIKGEEEDEEEYDDANAEEEISNSIGESVVVVQEGGDSSSSNLSIPEYFHQPASNSSKLQVPAGVTPEEVKRMVEAAVKKAREEAMADLQIQLQMATKQATKDLKEAKKDIKRLRKNVHDLNAELEAAEQEMAAQRTELERAGQRMERDRIRHKEEIDRKDKDNQDTISTITNEHKAAIKSMVAAHAEQVNEMQERLQRNEEARAKEGGDWQGELEQAVQREQESLKKVIALEDEKSTLLSQISTLQTTISSLQLRCDSLTITANTSSEREKEAEDRLDAALSLHARQLMQRQAREAELERSVAELGAALVVARQREQDRLRGGELSVVVGVDDKQSATNATITSQLATVQEELELLKAQLDLERQHCNTLQQELRDVANERSEEALVAIAKQRKHDRLVADLTAEIMALKNTLRDREQIALKRNRQGWLMDEDEIIQLRQHLSSLSEQVIRQQSRIDNLSSENSSLKSRLSSAISRAEQAENALSINLESTPKLDSSDTPLVALGRGRRRVRMSTSTGSIRAAFNIPYGRAGDRKEQFGQCIDALDKWSLETGKIVYTLSIRVFFLPFPYHS
jgi:hypothetical protein